MIKKLIAKRLKIKQMTTFEYSGDTTSAKLPSCHNCDDKLLFFCDQTSCGICKKIFCTKPSSDRIKIYA